MEWISIGRVTKTHGLKGDLKFYPSINETWVTEIKQIRLSLENPLINFNNYQIHSISGKDSPLIIKVKGVDSIEDASLLTGQTLYISQDKFPELPEDEYYWFQIEGLKVFDESGRYYGDITEIIRTGSNDVYVVRDDEKELLLPMIDSVVKVINLEEGKLIFHPMEGLLDDAAL